MIVQCPSCSSRYRVNASNIPSTGGKIRCPSCSHTFVVYPEQQQPAAAPLASSFEDKTSIAERPDLQQLLNNFQNSQAPVDDDAGATEIMSGDSLPNFNSMFNAPGGEDDGTVEMQNPLAFIKQWENQQNPGAGPPSTPPIPGKIPGQAPPKIPTQDNNLATEIVSPDMIFGNNLQPSIPEHGGDATQIASPDFGMQFGGTDPFGGATTEAPSPFSQQFTPNVNPQLAQAADPFAASQSPSDPFGLAGQAAPVAPAISGPDPNHQGPWKLKTNFGLTYEFVDTPSLLNWMSSRDDLDGYALAAGDGEFYPIDQFPQISQNNQRTNLNRPNMSTGPIQPVPAGGSMDMQQPAPMGGGFGQSPQHSGGGFGASAGGGFGAPPQPAQPRGAKINRDDNKLKSRDAGWNKVLWLLFFIFFIGVVLVGLQLGGVVDFKGMILGKEPAQPTPKVNTTPPKVTPKVVPKVETSKEDEIAEVLTMIKDARRFLKKNKAASAKGKLETARMLDPKNKEVYELLIKVYAATGEVDKAQTAKAKFKELGGTIAEPPKEDAPKEEKK